MIDDEKLHKTLDWLKDNAQKAATARAERVYMEEWIGSLRAQLAAKFIEGGDSATAADMKAKADPEYQLALKGYRESVEADELMRWHRTRADAIVEVWRTQAANQRAISKVV